MLITVSLFKDRYLTWRHTDRYLKNGVSKSIVPAIKPANFQFYRVYPDRII